MKNKNGKNNKTIISAKNKKGFTVQPKRQSSIVKKQIKTVNIMHLELLRKTIKGIFEIGEKILQIKETAIYDNWKNFVKDNFAFSYATAHRYIQVYEHFKDKPEYLECKTIKDVYYEIGIKKSLDLPEAPKGRLQVATDQEELEYDLEQIFKVPCVSKVKLENYRIESAGKNGRIWMIDRSGMSMPVAQLYAIPPEGFPETEYHELFREVQIAFERYFEKIEKYEKMGISKKVYNGY